MKIAYQLSLEDIIAFNVGHVSRSQKVQSKIRRNRFLIPFVYGVVALGLLALNTQFWPVSWFFGFLAVLWFIFYPQVWKQRVVSQVKKRYKEVDFNASHYAYELEFQKEGILASNAAHTNLLPWAKIINIEETVNHLFLFFTEDDGMIIPKKDFIEDNSWSEVIRVIKELHAAQIPHKN